MRDFSCASHYRPRSPSRSSLAPNGRVSTGYRDSSPSVFTLVLSFFTGADLTVIVPAYNEAASVADTILSLQAQTAPPREIIVVDDCSTDGTGDVARALGVIVVRPPANTGSKAGAQTFALRDAALGEGREQPLDRVGREHRAASCCPSASAACGSV